jgi:hypothetical protein
MPRSIAVALAALGLLSMAGTAVACPATASATSSQQTVMTEPVPNQTPIPTKPGS